MRGYFCIVMVQETDNPERCYITVNMVVSDSGTRCLNQLLVVTEITPPDKRVLPGKYLIREYSCQGRSKRLLNSAIQ